MARLVSGEVVVLPYPFTDFFQHEGASGAGAGSAGPW